MSSRALVVDGVVAAFLEGASVVLLAKSTQGTTAEIEATLRAGLSPKTTRRRRRKGGSDEQA